MKKRFLFSLMLMLLFLLLPAREARAENYIVADDGHGNLYCIDQDSYSSYEGDETVYIQGQWYAYRLGWFCSYGNWFYFDPDNGGRAVADGLLWEGDSMYYMGKDGIMKTGWISEKSEYNGQEYTRWYFAPPSGKLVTEWRKVSGKQYYFDPDSYVMYADELLDYDGHRYYFGADGVMKTNGWVKDVDEWGGSTSTMWYYATEDGTLFEGWKQLGGKWYYFYPEYCNMAEDYLLDYAGHTYYLGKDGAMKTNGWIHIVGVYSDEWYYAGADGALLTGLRTIDGKTYYFDPDECYMYAETVTLVDGKAWMFGKDGALYKKTGWVQLRGFWFYANGDGTPFIGWKLYGGHWYYLRPRSGIMETQVCVADGVLYTFNDDGWYTGSITKAGWPYQNGEWYYVKADGKAVTGWGYVDGKWYYFNVNGRMQTGAVYVEKEDKIYFFNPSGALMESAGWKKRSYTAGGNTVDVWYYTDKGGICRTGWQKIGGKWYYFDPKDAHMYAKGNYRINGVVYMFDWDGAWIP